MRETAYIIGKGPTHYDYSNIGKIDNPIFFINESALLSEEYPRNMKSRTFMFAQDRSTHKAMKDSSQYNCVIPDWPNNHKKYHKDFIDDDGNRVGDYAIIFDRKKRERSKCGEFIRRGLFKSSDCTQVATDKDRDSLEGTNYLPNLVGTIRCAVYFAFYTGISHIVLVGCDGIHKKDWEGMGLWSYDERLRDMISSKPYGSNNKHRDKAEFMMKRFGISYKFMGSPQ